MARLRSWCQPWSLSRPTSWQAGVTSTKHGVLGDKEEDCGSVFGDYKRSDLKRDIFGREKDFTLADAGYLCIGED